MGYMRHHAIIVTSWNEKAIEQAHQRARDLFPFVTEITPPSINNYRTFLVPPDGSKEGWDESDAGNTRRALFIEWLDAQRHDDNSTPLRWVEVQYGDDERKTIVTRHSDERPILD